MSKAELPSARIKDRPEDFVVEEVPLYEPSGSGDHLYVRFTKRGRTTEEAVRALALALGVDPRAAGVAGMKDKVAVTTQTVSLQPPAGVRAADLAARAAALSLPDLTVLDARPHGNKLKPGHLAANRFTLVLRGVDPARVGEVLARFEALGREGLPNHFGAQRFGRHGDNAERAAAWLSGRDRPPRDARLRRLLFSALQSRIFNAVLDARVAAGTWATALEGDLLKRRSSGGLFLCSDVQVDRERAKAGEVSPTGPMVGARMRWPEGAPGALEREISREILGGDVDLEPTRKLGEGTRRVLRLWALDLRIEPPSGEQDDGIRVYFVLPKGAYATTVVEACVRLESGGRPAGTNPTADASVDSTAERASQGSLDHDPEEEP